MDGKNSTSTMVRLPGPLVSVIESPTHDPVLNLELEASLAKTAKALSFRVWRSSDSVVPVRFLEPDREVHRSLAAELRVPVLRRISGGGCLSRLWKH